MRAELGTPAEDLLKKLILLLEHSVGRNDPGLTRLIADEILPAARAIGASWPGRKVYLDWYRRRGARLAWSPTASLAAQLAGILALRSDDVEKLFAELAAESDERMAEAAVRGLGEMAGPTEEASSIVRLLAGWAETDGRPALRLVIVDVLGRLRAADAELTRVLVDRARRDVAADVRLAAVRGLDDRRRFTPEVRDLLEELSGHEADVSLRVEALSLLIKRSPADGDLREVLWRVLRRSPDAKAVDAAARALVDRFGSADDVRRTLIDRGSHGRVDPVREVAVRLLGEWWPDDRRVADLLLTTIDVERDARTLTEAGRGFRSRQLARVRPVACDQLIRRLAGDADSEIRLTVVRLLADEFADDERTRAALLNSVRSDADGTVRLAAVTASVRWAAENETIRAALAERARNDVSPAVRLAAINGLAPTEPDVSRMNHLLVEAAVTDPDPRLRERALRLRAEGRTNDDSVLELLAGQSRDDGSLDVRLAAVGLMAEGSGAGGVTHRALVDRVRNDPSGRVFTAAAALVTGWLATETAGRSTLTIRAARDTNPHIRLSAAELLGRLHRDDRDVHALLLRLVSHDLDAGVVRAASTALAGTSASADSGGAVLLRMADPDSEVRQVAIEVLAECHPGLPGGLAALQRAGREDESSLVRRTALNQLAIRFTARAGVRDALVEALRDPDWAVRESVLRLLGEHDGHDERTRRLLVRLAADQSDQQLRLLAGQVLSWIPGADPDLLPSLSTQSPVVPPAGETPGSRVVRLTQVFRQAGMPTHTFVETKEFDRVRLALQKPGIGVIIEGPSGIGKTTILNKCLEDVGHLDQPVVTLSCRAEENHARLEQILENGHRGIFAVDDFHRLPETLQIRVADYLKALADDGAEDRKMIVIGIPDTRRNLIQVRRDLVGRIESLRIERVNDEDVRQMIRQGERALNVSFERVDEIVASAAGSLNIAQMLCLHVANRSHVSATTVQRRTVSGGIENDLAEVERTFHDLYEPAIRAFCSLDGDKRQTCIEVLLELAKSDGSLMLDTLRTRPDLSRDIKTALLERFPQGFVGPDGHDLKDHLFLDPRSRQLVVEDPRLLFYLRRRTREELVKLAGKRAMPPRSQIFISYSHQDAYWLEQLQLQLKPLQRRGFIDVFADTDLEPGDVWRDEIEAALERAKVAILLISKNFLASEFIHEVELPPLLLAAEGAGCKIWPLIVGPSVFAEIEELVRFQAVNKVSLPLSRMTGDEPDTVLADLAAKAMREFPLR